jgi:mannose-6-phosphate isomerase class I
MANSDNVLRGGLTSKHVDVAELMNVLSFASGRPQILEGEAISSIETVYPTPAEEFELSRLRVMAGKPHSGGAANGPEILLVVEGDATVRAGQQSLDLKRGQIVLVPHGLDYLVETQKETAGLFKAGIPRI